MADRRKKATGRSQGGGARRGVKRRSRAAPAGRTAVRRDTPVARAPAMDANSVQVREQIDAAITEAQRIRHDIEARIERRFHTEQGDLGSGVGILPPLPVGERFRMGPVQPFFIEPPTGEETPRKRSRKSAR